MDATTNQKTLSALLVALLVGSIFVAAVPTASAQTPVDPTDSPNVVVDARGDSGNTVIVTGGPIEFNQTYDLTITNMSASAADIGGGIELLPSGGSVVETRTSYRDDAHGEPKLNVTFPAVTLGTVGTWIVRNATTDAQIATFQVEPKTNLQVTLSQSTFTFTEAFTTFTVTVLEQGTGAPAANVDLVFDIPQAPGVAKTNANGQYVFSGYIGSAGTFTVTAQKNVSGSPEAEFRGTATFTVNAAGLTVNPVQANVLSGFDELAIWNITYPINTTGVFARDTFDWYNLTVTLPSGQTFSSVYVNDTDVTAPTPLGVNATEGGLTVTGWTWAYDANGNFSFRPGAQWEPGTYTFNLRVNSLGNAVPEYQTSWSITTAAPAAVNLDVEFLNADITNLTVRGLEGTYGQAGFAAGNYDLEINIVGASRTEFPLAAFFTAANVTVTGDVLPGYSVVVPGTLGASNGTIYVNNLVPTKFGGEVAIAITWKNGATVRLPIVGGAILTTAQETILVDNTTSLTVTLTDQYGNPIPDGGIYVFQGVSGGLYPGVGAFQISGTGAPGLGQNGQYTLNLKPTAVGNLTVYGVVGDAPHFNYSYVNVRVVPAHDIQVAVQPNATMAALRTQVLVNATLPSGANVLSGNAAVFFLNQSEVDALRANGSLPSGNRMVSVTSGVAGAPNGVVVHTANAGTAAGMWLNVTLDAGTYWVYVCSDFTTSCSDAKHDSLDDLEQFVVVPYDATFSPAQIGSNPNIQNNTEITVTIVDREGNPANGTLRIASGSQNIAAANATLNSGITVWGNATFRLTGNNVLGDIVFEFNPFEATNTTAFAPVDDKFSVVGPNVQVTPDRIPVGRASTLVILVRSINDQPQANVSVRICGPPLPGGNETNPACTASVLTGSDGQATVGVFPTTTGTLTLLVNNQTTPTTVKVFAGLQISHTPERPSAGDTVTVTVRDISGAVMSGVNVTYTMNGTTRSQNTDASGQILIPSVQVGTINVTASRAGFETAVHQIVVGQQQAPDQTGARFSLDNLQVPESARVGEPAQVSVDVTNSGAQSGTATLSLFVNERFIESKSVPVDANDTVTVDFTFTPNTAGTFPIEVRLQGGEPVSDTIQVGQQPVTTTPTSPTGPTPTSPTVTSPTVTSPTVTSPTVTSPTTTSPATTTPTTTPEVPGFEVVGLIAALGAALLVLRRRS